MQLPPNFNKIYQKLIKIKSKNKFEQLHKRTYFIFILKIKKEINNELYNFLCEYQFIDINLTKYWKKQGYENLCCTLCIYVRDKNNFKVCVCRVPGRKFFGECGVCQCTGCGG